jgi:hypothetical protein
MQYLMDSVSAIDNAKPELSGVVGSAGVRTLWCH